MAEEKRTTTSKSGIAAKVTRRLRHLRPISIRRRLLVAFVLTVFLSAVAISAITVIVGMNTGKQRAVDQLESVATFKESDVRVWLENLEVNLSIVASEQAAIQNTQVLMQESAGSVAYQDAYYELQERFQWAAQQMGLFEELFMMDTAGQIVVSTDVSREGQIHSNWHYFTEGLAGYYVQPPSYSLSTGQTFIIASCPVGEEEILGVMAGRATLDSLNEIMLERVGLGDTGETYLVGANYRLLTPSRFEGYEVGETYIHSDGADAAVNEQAYGSSTYTSYRNNSVIGVYRWLPEIQVALLAEQESGEALHATQVALRLLGGVALVAVVIAGIASVFVTRSIVAPLDDLAETATQIAAGDLDRVAKVHRKDEVGTVAKAFNSMTAQLRGTVGNLEHQAEHLRAINEVGRKLSSILDLDDLLPYVAQSLQETFNYHNVGIILIDPDSGALLLKASAGSFEGGPDIGSAAIKAEGIASWVAQNGEPLLINDIVQDLTYGSLEGQGDTRAELAVPIKIGEEIVGVLDLEEDRIDAFDELDLFTAQTLADQLAVAIENARLYEQAQELATVEERQRLARDLHDAVTQTLFSASLIAEVVPRLWEKKPDEGRRRLEELRQLTRGALAEMRMLLLELRPAALTEVGLGDLLRHVTDAITGRSELVVTLTVEGQRELPAEVQITLYRIAQEALNNISKHAGASEVTVTLRFQPDSVELMIRDNGSGFDPNAVSGEHLGLGIMHERAESIGALLEIESEIDRGTGVRVWWREE